MMKIKFSAVILPDVFPYPRLNKTFHFDDSTFVKTDGINSLISSEDNSHWKEWLGSLAWEDIANDQAICLVSWCEAKQPGVLDGENKSLTQRTNNLLEALLLSGPFRLSRDNAHQISGDGEINGAQFKLQSIRETGRVDPWYSVTHSRDDYWEWIQHLGEDKSLENWKSNFQAIEKLYSLGEATFLIRLSLMAFHYGIRDLMLDFRLPNLIRSLETIVALPAGKGKFEFSRRVKSLLPSNLSLPFEITHETIGLILEEGYQIRSDCVHGKPFAETLRKRLGENFEEQIPRYSFGIEEAARLVIQRAISDKNILSYGRDRQDLENAWASNLLPQ